jgi:cysteine synthase A
MTILQGFVEAVGNTPLIEISSLSKLTGCRILGKAEFLNPGGSVKDRAARAIVLEAERTGQLKPGGTIVEGTAGNTGIGLAHVANARGYRCVIVIPDSQSAEKMQALRALGVDLRPVPPAPYSDPGNFNHVARRLAEEMDNAFWADQFDNTANAVAHEVGTGAEIVRQTQGQIDGFICAVGTGGSLAGCSRALKKACPGVVIGCVDPGGAAMYSYFKSGHLNDVEGNSITEGIGQVRVTRNVALAAVDVAYRIFDPQVLEMVHFVNRREGLFLGSSAALNLCGAVSLAKKLGKGKTIVTILCDGGARYASRLFNSDWLEEKGLVTDNFRLHRKYQVDDIKDPSGERFLDALPAD